MSLFELCDDIMELIEIELRPRLKYNQVVREYKDPRFHKSANRITKNRRDVHPGRHYLRVIYPTFEGFSSYRIDRFKCQDINLHGMLIRTNVRHYNTDVNVSSETSFVFILCQQRSHIQIFRSSLPHGYNLICTSS